MPHTVDTAQAQLHATASVIAGLGWPRKVACAPASKEAVKGPAQEWVKVSVDLPAIQTSFPRGDGSVIAKANGLICRSAGMVLNQPPLTHDEWKKENNKMQNAFGAPLPADQVEALARYLGRINSRRDKDPSAADGGVR